MTQQLCNKKAIDLAHWPRAQHFTFFKDFTQPYFNVCVAIDMAALYQACKRQNFSFFQAYIYCTLDAVNSYKPMRYRVIDDQPYELEHLRASVVELADDDTFRFSYFQMQASFNQFSAHANAQSQQAKKNPLFSEAFAKTEGQADLVHISVLPWLNFTGFSHAITDGVSLGIPKLVFGQFDRRTGLMPLSIDVHHALMDGLHVAKFVQVFQEAINKFVKHLP